MELKHFRLIKTITEERSLANSSEKLFLTQSALSHQLREMEERLGFKVFFRSRNKWKLSEQGQELYLSANSIFKIIDEGFINIDQINKGSKGKVRIGTECYTFYQGFPAFIQKMGILYPDIEVDIVLDSYCQPLSKLISNEIDIAIISSKSSIEKMASIELYTDEIMCLMHKEHPFADVDYLQPHHFPKLDLIIHSYPMESVAVYEHFLKLNNTAPKSISAIPFTIVALEMVAANMGVMCIPRWSLKPIKISDQIILKKINKKGLKKTQYLVFKEGAPSKQYINDFILNIKEEFIGKAF